MPKAIQRTFGSVIRERRRQLDLTQEDVATRIKTSTPYIGHLESGKRHPSEKVIARLGEVLGLQSRELFFLANPRTRDLLGTANSGGRRSAWEEFRHDERLRRAHNISAEEMDVLGRVAAMGEARAARDFIYILNAIRLALSR
ncbi:MAG TPA: helix-turn-helix transcriptional regulator [Candidatus Binataceae bacterium]|jgi:transcriptional regulator with XRE-family HTH domain|nr:helix-turn-helix transcriptional regulator [Candidatus Binataceae bacterium]